MLTIKNQPRNPRGRAALVSLMLILNGCTPPGPKALIQGEKFIEKGKYSEAIEKLKLATALVSTNAHAWNYLGLAYHYAHRPDEAEKTYRRALLIDHDLSEAHYNLGCLYLEQKKNEAAKTELLAYTLRRANSLDGLLKLGAAQLRVNEFTAAEKTFQDALKLSPQNAEALNGLGCIRAHQRGRANEAVGYFRAALKSQSNFPPAILNWAIVAQQQTQDKRLALQKYREYCSLKLPVENVQAVKSVALQLERELNPPPVVSNNLPVQVATNALTQRPLVTNIIHPSANVSPRAATIPTVKSTANTAKPPSPIIQSPPPNSNGVKVSPEPIVKPATDFSPVTQSTSSENGRADSIGAPSVNRVQAEQLFAEARRAQQAHRLADAINYYRASSQQDPTYFDAYYNLGLALSESGNLAAAISSYESALTVRPDSLEARYNLALVLKQNGDFGRAAVQFEALLQKYPNDTRSHLALGNLYAQQLREPSKARPHYVKVLEIDPRNPQASAIRFWLASNPQ